MSFSFGFPSIILPLALGGFAIDPAFLGSSLGAVDLEIGYLAFRGIYLHGLQPLLW